jgi:hypothetical protein
VGCCCHTGGISGDILNLIAGLIKGTIESKLDSAVTSLLTNFMNTDANVILNGFMLSIPLSLPAPYNIATVMFDIVDAPTFGANYVGADLQGEVVNTAKPVNPPFSPAPLPVYSADSGNHMLQVRVCFCVCICV